jgi:energy-coupling factor transporter ATP-binding protein EcfA2
MIKNKETFLKQVALMPELRGNKISLVFALRPQIDISNKTKFVDNVSTYFIMQKEEDREKIDLENDKKESVAEKWLGKDLRIKNIKLKSIRGYPNNKVPFGIDFTSTLGNPQSMIILGSNGSGKSSIYNSIEYNYCKRIGEAQLRTNRNLDDEDNEFKEYLSHFNNGFNNSMCDIVTVDEKFTLHSMNIPQEVRSKINPNTHFISDFDIYHNGKLNFLKGDEGSFHNLIAESLGLRELLQFEKNLNEFVAYRRATESTRINALEKGIKEENHLIDNNKKTLAEKKSNLLQLTDSQKEQPENKKYQEIQKILAQIKSSKLSFQFETETLQSYIAEFEQKYKEFISLEIKSGKVSQIQFYNLGLELLKELNECPFCNSSNKSVDDIQQYVSEKIKQIESFNKLNNELTKSQNFVTENLDSFFNNVALHLGKVKQERSSIRQFSEFSELASTENSYITFIESALAEEFFQVGSGMNSNDKYKLNKNEFLISFFVNHKDYLQNGFSAFILELNKFAEERGSLIKKIEAQLTQSLQSKNIFEQIVTIKNEIVSLEQQITNSEKKIQNSNIELKNFREQQAVFNAIKEEARIYNNAFHTLLSEEVQQAFAPIKLIVEEVLEKYLKSDNREVELEIKMKEDDVDSETGEVLSEIITAYIVPKDNSHPPLPVNKYFNTFHYRLFSTMVGVSIAMASRINTKINMPLVLDDIFYASDFENRATVERFIKELFDIFNKYTPNLELQLILFTHDQLIFESAVKATAEMKVENIAFARLFHHSKAKDSGDVLELAYRMPTYLPYKIMQNTLTEK